jgi:MFS family permease
VEEKARTKALNLSIIDGALSALMGSLAGGVFLMGFAIKVLGAKSYQIGILASLPMFANMVQIFGSYIIERTGRRKMLCFLSVVISRAVWLIIIMLPLALFSPLADFRIWILIGIIGLSSLFGSLSGVAWISWMSDLVPEKIRGAYFGKRNMIASGCGMAGMLLGGKFITLWENRFQENNAFGFMIIFIVGLFFGTLAFWFLSRIPEIGPKDKKEGFNFSLFFNPLKDKNFLWLILFVSSWMFGSQIAAPFYGVFMIAYLKIDFSSISIFGTLATLTTLLMMKIWGPITDRLGNRPVIIVSGWALILVPFIWILALPERYYLPLVLAHILSGAFMAGKTLSHFNILIKLSPREGRSIYIALFAAITGVVGAVAPVIGGILSRALEGFALDLFGIRMTNLHLVFILSALLQLSTIFLILKVKEPAAATPVAVIMSLKNDLNPQTGIASSTDFVMVEVKRTREILKRLDEATDKVADRSEETIRKGIEKAEPTLRKVLEKIYGFLKSD